MFSLKTPPQFNHFAWYVLLGCLVSTALAMSVIRFWLLPRAADWRGDLQAEIGAMIGETVRIKALSAGMRGFKPELMMRGFSIENAAWDGPNLEFERLGVGLDVTGSLVSGKPVINRIEVEGGRLRLTRKSDGSVGILGLKPGKPPFWLFAEGEIRFVDIDIEWIEGEEGKSMGLGRAQARLRNQGGGHVLDVRMDLPGKLGKALKLSAVIEGNPLVPEPWNGRAYLEAKRLREGAFGDSLPLRMRSGEAGFQAWGEWRNGAFTEAVGKVDLDRPVFTWRGADGKEGMLGLDRLAGWLRWRGEVNGWRLDATRFALAHNGRSWPETGFAIAVGHAADGSLQTLRAAFNYLHLEDAQNILAGLPLMDDKLGETLRMYSPRGEVRNGKLVYQTDGHFGFCGDLAGLGLNPAQEMPGVSRFNGRLCGSDRGGRIDMKTAKTELNLPGLFLKPVAIDAMSGSLQWRRFGENALFPPAKPAGQSTPETPEQPKGLFESSAWRIVGNRIELAAPGLQAKAGFAIDLPGREGESPAIDFNAQFGEIDAAGLRDYLPLAAMDAGSAKWLGEAFDGGKVKKADVLFRGKVADFPFRTGEGQFESHVDVENLELDFNPEWPHVYGINAKILLFGPKMFVDTEGGRIGEIPLKPIHAETEDFIGDGWLGLVGDLDTDLASASNLLQKTPIRYIPERLSRVADLSGDIHLDLKLSIPLNSSQGDVGVGGLLQLKNDSLALKNANLKLQELWGELSFTENGMAGKQIAGKALDQSILIDVDQQRDNIFLDVSGAANVAALRKAFPSDLWRYSDGGFAYRLNLQIPASLDSASEPLRMGLQTDLGGLELKLPAPLVKAPAQKKPFSAEMVLRRGDQLSLKLGYGNEGGARLLFSLAEPSRLERGDISWGKPLPPPADENGLGLYLKMDELDAGAWRKLIDEISVQPITAAPRALDIQLARLSWNGEDLGHLMLFGRRVADDLLGEVDCGYARGNYALATSEFGHSTLRLDLDSLKLPKFPEVKEEGQTALATPDPTDLPSLQIRAGHLLRQGVDLGELELEAERWTQGIHIKRLNLATQNHDLALRGNWTRQEGRDETKLEGNLNVRDLGFFLTLLGYGKEILFTPTQAAFSLAWDGPPQRFSSAGVTGEVRLKLGRGSVLQMEPGLGRALGVLNLQTLRRLLLLDFRDLFGKGLAYDSMEGAFRLDGGQATTKGFMIDAVAADILVIGRVGLANHDFDETVSVVPHAMASIPLAGAIVGGSAVGAVIDMANRLVGAEESNIASTNYSVTGTWDNLQIKRLQGSMALEVIDRTWSDFKNMSGMGNKGDDN